MKKLLSIFISLSLILSMVTVSNAAYTDVDNYADYRLSALRLQDLGIISGYDDGSFRADNTITRAEFTKIVVCMMDKEEDAIASNAASGFFDVQFGSWYAPYINYAVSKDILSGYADGSFAPNSTINFAEAITILLRTIGYSEETVGYFWPDNYINAASTLSITKGLDCSATDMVTRATASILVDRALFTKPQGADAKNCDTYLETVGYTVLDDALILDNDIKSDNVTVLYGNMKQNSASAYLRKTQLPLYSGDIYDYAVIDKNGYLATVRECLDNSDICSVTGAVNKLTENTIEYTTVDGLKSSYRADDNFIIYSDGSKMNFTMAKSKITSGIDITFYGNNYGLWNIAVIGGNDSITPVLASKNYTENEEFLAGQPITHTNLTVYRNGESAKLSDIKQGDVVYYNTKINVMDVYSKKVSGTYYSAAPSKAYVESVTVAGKSYEIGYSAATSKLDASTGAYNIGDKITLFLGKDDKVVFVSDNATGFDYSAYGVVISSEVRTATEGPNEGNSECVTKMFMPDGEIHDIVTDKLYNQVSGKLMHISYSNNVAKLNSNSSNNKDDYIGNINLTNRTVNGNYFLKDAVIIQRTSDEDAQVASCEILNFNNITAKKIDSKQLLDVVSTSSFGDIAILYVQSLENTGNFGIISGYDSENVNGTTVKMGYKIFSNGIETTYYPYTSNLPAFATGISFRIVNGAPTNLVKLLELSNGIVSAVDGLRIKLGKTTYSLADNVQIFDATSSSKIKSITVDELEKLKSVSATLYSDKSVQNGGLVKVIVIKQ